MSNRLFSTRRLARSLIGLCLLAVLAGGFFMLSPSRQAPTGNVTDANVTGVSWTTTGGAEPEPVPAIGATLTPGQRISTAAGQSFELYVGRIRIALRPNTVIVVGDSDPGTEAGNFEIVAGSISVTVYKGEFATIDAPRLKAVTHGADFSMHASEEADKVDVQGGAVTILANGTTTELGADQLAIVTRDSQASQAPQVMSAAAAQEAATKAAQAWKLKEIRLDQADADLDPATLPKPGALFPAGVQISTMRGSEIWIERDTAGGRDVVKILPKSLVTVGDADPATERPDLAILAGAMKIKADDALFVYAPHLTATIGHALAEVSTNPKASSVAVAAGTVDVSSILTGETRAVPTGVIQLVRAQNTPPIEITPDMGHVEQMQ